MENKSRRDVALTVAKAAALSALSTAGAANLTDRQPLALLALWCACAMVAWWAVRRPAEKRLNRVALALGAVFCGDAGDRPGDSSGADHRGAADMVCFHQGAVSYRRTHGALLGGAAHCAALGRSYARHGQVRRTGLLEDLAGDTRVLDAVLCFFSSPAVSAPTPSASLT